MRTRAKVGGVTWLVVALVSVVGDAAAQEERQWVEDAKLMAEVPEWGDRMGISVAIDDGTMVTGAPEREFDTGTVFLFERSGDGYSETELLPDDLVMGDEFGASVAVEGDLVVVGAPGASAVPEDDASPESGAVYLFNRTAGGWDSTRLAPSDPGGSGRFGAAVAVAPGAVLVGAPGVDRNDGVAYLYELVADSWVETKLANSDVTQGQAFGSSVAISAEALVVGAPHNGTDGLAAGAAYVFDRANLQQPHRLTRRELVEHSLFGSAVAISGETVVAGAPIVQEEGTASQGVAYVFQPDGDGFAEQRLVPPEEDIAGRFGEAVDIEDDLVVVGAWNDVRPDGDPFKLDFAGAGTAYAFRKTADGWSTARIRASDGTAADHFGSAVAIAGNSLAIGAPDVDSSLAGGAAAGAVYVFDFEVPAPPADRDDRGPSETAADDDASCSTVPGGAPISPPTALLLVVMVLGTLRVQRSRHLRAGCAS